MKQNHLLERLAYFAACQPEKIAISVLNSQDIDVIDTQLTYLALYQSVCRLTQVIASKTKPSDRVFLCYPTGTDFAIAFYACLMARVIAVAITVPSNLSLVNKGLAMLDDCKPTLLLTDRDTQDKYIHSSPLAQLNALITNEIEPAPSWDIADTPMPTLHAEDIAFLQYTSGSTACPKGVMISHGNLVDNIMKMSHAFEGTRESIGLNWLPHTHDMGLIGSFLHSVYQGAEIYLMSPASFIRRPMSWLKALSKYNIEITGGPSFSLKLCTDHFSPNQMTGLDLQHLRYIIVGSEPISHAVVRDFLDALAPFGLSAQAFAPSYGLAEATLMVSTRVGLHLNTLDYSALNHDRISPPDQASTHSTAFVSCGTPGQTIQIVSGDIPRVCLENEVGEVWLHGDNVAQGYWQKEEENQHHFNATLPNDDRRYFRTGDLGFLHQNELYIVGRIKDIIIINGLNHYPEDIEKTVLLADETLHPATCAAFSWRETHDATDQFIILIRPHKRLPDESKAMLTLKIKQQLLKAYQLVPYDIQFVTASLPKTTSGKIQRNACKPLYLEHREQQREMYVKSQ